MEPPRDEVVPSQDDPLVAVAAETIGGPLGRHASTKRARLFTPTRLILAIAGLCMVFGMVQKAPCVADDWGSDQVRYTAMCYSDLPYLYTGRGLAELKWPYSSDIVTRARYDVMEYPVGIAYWAWGAAWVTHWLNGSPDLAPRAVVSASQLWTMPGMSKEINLYVAVNAVGFALCGLLAAWLLTSINLARDGRRRPWDAAAFVISPVLASTALINWDLLAVVTVAGALWAWRKDRPVLTGVMIGLGTATKLYPLFLLGALLVICWRRKRMTDWVAVVAAGFLAWVVVDMPAMLTGLDQWKHFWTFNSTRAADLGSVWLLITHVFGVTFTAHQINVVSWGLFVVWCLVVAAIGIAARRTARFSQLGFLIVVGFLVINKVYSPQYVLWLLPLAVMARPRWVDQLVWQLGEMVYFAGVWWWLGGYFQEGSGTGTVFYDLTIAVRVAAEIYLVVKVIRDVLAKDDDIVDADEDVVAPVTAPASTPVPGPAS